MQQTKGLVETRSNLNVVAEQFQGLSRVSLNSLIKYGKVPDYRTSQVNLSRLVLLNERKNQLGVYAMKEILLKLFVKN